MKSRFWYRYRLIKGATVHGTACTLPVQLCREVCPILMPCPSTDPLLTRFLLALEPACQALATRLKLERFSLALPPVRAQSLAAHLGAKFPFPGKKLRQAISSGSGYNVNMNCRFYALRTHGITGTKSALSQPSTKSALSQPSHSRQPLWQKKPTDPPCESFHKPEEHHHRSRCQPRAEVCGVPREGPVHRVWEVCQHAKELKEHIVALPVNHPLIMRTHRLG